MEAQKALCAVSNAAANGASAFHLKELCSCLQSWHPYNLFNVWHRANVYEPENWQLGRNKITTQRILAKRLIQGYHLQHIKVRQLRFKYLAMPPTWRIKAFRRKASSDPTLSGQRFSDSLPFPQVPYHSMMFAPIEQRLDTVLFRACLAPSIYDARTLISKGYVKVEGQIVRSWLEP